MGTEHPELLLMAPLGGWCTPLDEVPDPVFAGRMLGPGVAIDPIDAMLHAPCDGEIIALPASRHAVTLRATNGAELLMHVGIDTVGLQGEGFESLVSLGDRVHGGMPLLRFDLDLLARRAASLLTPVIVVNDGYSIAFSSVGALVRLGDHLLTLRTDGWQTVAAQPAASSARSAATVTQVVVGLAHGLHARPAARIAEAMRASRGRVTIAHDGRAGDARSVTELMMLGVRRGDEVTLESDAATSGAVVKAIIDVLAAADERASSLQTAPASPVATAVTGRPARAQAVDGSLSGVAASRGLAIGVTHRLQAATFEVPEQGAGLAHEAGTLERALQDVRGDLQLAAAGPTGTQREVAAAHMGLLDDPALVGAAEKLIAHGASAGHAWRTAVRSRAAALENLEDDYLRERAADLRDLEARILTALGHQPATHLVPLPDRAVVLGREILPSQFAALQLAKVAGICTSGGGPTSHVAIMANAIGLPMVVAAGPELDAIDDGHVAILDARVGRLTVEPDAAQLKDAEHAIALERAVRDAQRSAAMHDARTADGRRIHVYANLGSPGDASAAVGLGAEGCGLLRTEFLFLDRRLPPAESEQLEVYQAIAALLEGRPLTIRTMDIGGDKPIDYLPLPHEDNPALGLRGVRTSLWRPDLLCDQLRAILRVQPAGQCRILLPMITDVGEVVSLQQAIDSAMRDLGVADRPRLGVMIETPAAAVLADTLAPHVDFLSIGSNDLTQYTLAMDRGHPELAARLDGLHPAVLRLIDTAARAAAAHGREVAVCGNLAVDPLAISILVGLGIEELSVAHAAIPAVKARIAALDFATCRTHAERALACSTADQVRALVHE